jgi:hypothetical protein
MISVDGKGYGCGYQFWFSDQGPENQIPVLEPFFSENPEPQGCPEKGKKPLNIKGSNDFRGFEFPK